MKLMDTQAIIEKLGENEAALKARGVSHAALFGSRARGESRPGSDIDILVEIEPSFPDVVRRRRPRDRGPVRRTCRPLEPRSDEGASQTERRA